MTVCEGEYTDGCPEEDETDYDNVTLDAKDSVKGDYKLEISSIDSGETMYVTLSYYTPTAIIKSIEKGRRSVVGNLTTFKKVTIESQSKFTMGDLRYRDKEISCENVVDVLKCRPSMICDIPIGYTCPTELKLGSLGMGESLTFYIWHVEKLRPEEITFFDKIFDWFLENVWGGGKIIELEKGSALYYSLRWLSSIDSNGNYYVPTYRLIIVGSGLVLILGLMVWFRFRRKFRRT